MAGTAAGDTPVEEPAKETEEQKKSTFGSKLRAILFYVTTLLIAIPLFVVMLVIFPFQYLFDKYRRRGLHVVNNLWANLTTALFYKIEVIGAENLPPKGTPAVYIANHQSYLDIFSLFRLWVPFKFVSKTSNFLLPIVGWSMFLTGHIPLKRMDARSQAQCLKACRTMLDNGGSVIFFPEGTRSLDQKLAPFKKGAFSIATKAKMPIVPITLVGTGKLMPSGQEGSLHSGGVKIIVHPPMMGTDPNQLMADSREVIYNTLVEYGAET
ncbi:lysophosphatidic acid acyltransferase [Klebsormidium nitens]|uniref:1-acyl-sn-glycerol-3-phosphate acyltransferase n=1 Tax=Klebsormidium nitens TaxID=105231 RepID=A0A1Y1II32_KLENI|nr:lysophosphatidic acid acyltransferase [Klebsormidium nitens]|eukprot:GAQ90540.1 lysophosphatidic acid acyltransferase [Klebsormidium nitens]